MLSEPVAALPVAEPTPRPRRPVSPGGRWPFLDLAALLLALAVLLGPVARAGGGRDPHAQVLALASLLPVLVLGRVGQVGRWPAALALSPAVAATVVCATAPTGWAGAGDIARFTYGGLLWIAVRAVARTEQRRAVVLAALSIGGLWQFQQAYLPWWGSGDAAHAMTGTFFAANVFSAYMAGIGLAAAALGACGVGRLRLVGIVAAPFCLAAVIFSACRAMIGLSLAMVAAGALVLLTARSFASLARLLVLVAASLGLALVLASPSLMPHGGGAFAGAAEKSGEASQTLAFSGGVRLEWWRAAGAVGAEHPLSGAGFGSFGSAESRYQPAGQERSIYAHNVLLQGWADGGLTLFLPLSVILLGLLWALRARGRQHGLGSLAGLMGAGAMSLHALLDVDAQYSACLAVLLVLAAVASADRGCPDRRQRPAAGKQVATAVLVVLVVGVLAGARSDAADAQYRRGQLGGGSWTGATGPFRDARFDVLRLARGEHDAGLLARTATLQQDSATVTWTRTRALVAAGHPDQARQLALTAWRQRAVNEPGQVTGVASVLMALSDRAGADTLLVTAFRAALARRDGDADAVSILTGTHGVDPELSLCLIAELPSPLQSSHLPVPTAGCRDRLRPYASGSLR